MKRVSLVLLVSPLLACGASPDVGDHDSGYFSPDSSSWDAGGSDAAALEGGGDLLPDGAVIPADRFVTQVVSFLPGDCAGFGADQMPGIVEGPPQGAGNAQGSTDVVSLGHLGTIVVGFAPNAIVDGPGPDFVVFENAFNIGGDPTNVYAEPGEVSVSDDGVVWHTFPCTTTMAPYQATCAGIHPVYSSAASGISPLDYPACGGDGLDLAAIGVNHAKFLRIHDIGWEDCPADPAKKTRTNGFDLDAVSLLNAELP